MLSIVAVLVVAQASPSPDICRNRTSRWRICEPSNTTASYAHFELAPADGAGMGSACACAAITGAKGETVTVTRASSAFCNRGALSSGIANGDLVSCSSNQPRVMSGGSGSLGLLSEAANTNDLLRSQELDNASWVPTSVGVAVPTVTANTATAPDGTSTADTLSLNATAAGQNSTVIQAVAAAKAGGTGAACIYLKGVSGSGTTDLCTTDGTSYTCTACSFNSSTWTRCKREGVTIGAANNWTIGNATNLNGGTTRPAQAVYAWGAEQKSYGCDSYIATAGATATRAADVISAATSLTNTTGSFSVRLTPLRGNSLCSAVSDCGIMALSVAGPSYRQLMYYAPGTFLAAVQAGSSAVTRSYVAATETEAQLAGWWDASNVAVLVNSAQTTGATGTPYTATTLVELGNYNGARQINSILKSVCVDPDISRCR